MVASSKAIAEKLNFNFLTLLTPSAIYFNYYYIYDVFHPANQLPTHQAI